MARWTETWLSGPVAAGVDERVEGDYRGCRLGLPEHGPGSVAGAGARTAAFFLDAFASALVAALFVSDPVDPRRGLLGVAVLAVEYLVLVSLTGQTLGMRMLKLRVQRLSEPDGPPGFLPTAVRTALLLLLLPALVFDRDGRGLHDKAGGVVVLRAGSV